MALYDRDDPQAQEYEKFWRGVSNRIRIKGLAKMGYQQNGQQIIHVNSVPGSKPTHIADAGDTEKAHFLTTAANAYSDPNSFVAQSMVTCSQEFHGDLVARSLFVQAVNDAIAAISRLDKIKKSLFYGRDNNIEPRSGEASMSNLPALVGGDDYSLHTSADIVHGVLGVATEAGELLEGLRDAYNGKGVDAVNVMEERGDVKWYLAILAHAFGHAWRDDESRVISKLRTRYGDKFTAFDANNRDLAAERTVLEGGTSAVDQMSLPAQYREKRMEGETLHDGNATQAAKIEAARTLDDPEVSSRLA